MLGWNHQLLQSTSPDNPSVFKSILEDDKYFEENIEENHSEIFTLSILENNVVRDVDYNITEIGSFISLIRKL